MKYVVRPASSGNGKMSVIASDAREAVQLARALMERGVPAVEVLDEREVPCDWAELVRLADEAAASLPSG